MSSDELVSVIMSTYNDEKYIKEAINSILYQTYENIEFLIIDDASTDNTSKILDSITDSRIRVIHNFFCLFDCFKSLFVWNNSCNYKRQEHYQAG